MALYLILIKSLTKEYGALKVTSISMLAGVFFLLAITIFNGEMAYLAHLTIKDGMIIPKKMCCSYSIEVMQYENKVFHWIGRT